MSRIHPNERYTKTGKFIEEQPIDPTVMCNCECHNPGRVIMHCAPCCDFTYQTRVIIEDKK